MTQRAHLNKGLFKRGIGVDRDVLNLVYFGLKSTTKQEKERKQDCLARGRSLSEWYKRRCVKKLNQEFLVFKFFKFLKEWFQPFLQQPTTR